MRRVGRFALRRMGYFNPYSCDVPALLKVREPLWTTRYCHLQ
jgi:hypothetical protein